MEKRVNVRIQQYVSDLKHGIRDKIIELGFDNLSPVNELLEYVCEYDRLTLQKDDFIKRKRLQNSIPLSNRCSAKRANGEQCTRRRREDCEFCGTHYKGTPHGLVAINDATGTTGQSNTSNQKVEVIAKDIKGIVYYVDKYDNVYKTEDILHGGDNPRIIAKCVRVGEIYTIPEFGLV